MGDDRLRRDDWEAYRAARELWLQRVRPAALPDVRAECPDRPPPWLGQPAEDGPDDGEPPARARP